MISDDVTEVAVNGTTVTIEGTMLSRTVLVLTGDEGAKTVVDERVPFTMVADDNGPVEQNTGDEGADRFSLTVEYTPTNDDTLDQSTLFGTPATFAGASENGDVVVDVTGST